MYNKRFSSRPKYTPRRTFGRNFSRPNYTRSRPETKVIDHVEQIGFTESVTVNGNNFWVTDFKRVNGCAQGTSVRQRIGNKIKLKNTKFRLVLTAAAVKGNLDAETALPARISAADYAETGATYQAGYDVPASVITAGPEAVRTWVQTNGNGGWVTRDDDGPSTGTYVSVVKHSATSTSTANNGNAVMRWNTDQYKYSRSVFRVVVICDRQQQPSKETIVAGEIFEPEHTQIPTEPWSTCAPGVLSNLNSANFGRYQVLYDKTVTCDADDPTKIVQFDIKKQCIQSYTSADASSVRDGSLYFGIFEMTPDVAGGSWTAPETYMTIRTTFTDC